VRKISLTREHQLAHFALLGILNKYNFTFDETWVGGNYNPHISIVKCSKDCSDILHSGDLLSIKNFSILEKVRKGYSVIETFPFGGNAGHYNLPELPVDSDILDD
jgi:hypothetical protein